MYNFLQYSGNYENAYTAIIFIFCFGMILSSLEYLAIKKEFTVTGIFSWKIFSSRSDYVNSRMTLRKLDFFFGYTGFIFIHSIRLICFAWLPFAGNYYVKSVLLFLLVVTSLLISFRTVVGLDGSDQMNSILCITLLIVFTVNNPFVYKAGLIFIAAQSLLSYLVAGTAKLLSKKWRRGEAVYQIMNTRTYGYKAIASYLSTAPRLVNLLLCWGIILFEMLFFLVIFLPYPWLFIFIFLGIAFHAYNAVAMGLNNFFWSFTATYPAVLFVQQLLGA